MILNQKNQVFLLFDYYRGNLDILLSMYIHTLYLYWFNHDKWVIMLDFSGEAWISRKQPLSTNEAFEQLCSDIIFKLALSKTNSSITTHASWD